MNMSKISNENLPSESIAVIGMSARFPGAETLGKFWENLRDGVESISFFREEDIRNAGVGAEMLARPDYIRAKGVLDHIEEFDAAFFRISPREAQLMDPQHRIFLECAWQAMENAAHNPWTNPGRIGVFASAGKNTYLLLNLLSQADWAHHEEVFQLLIGNEKDYLATRASYHLNLTGPSLTVQSACSSSLLAIHLACQSLLLGECDIALAGGVSVDVPRQAGYLHRPGGILSRDGHCRPFDAQASGTVFSQGAGVVVLRRLGDALSDGDFVHALVRGSAVNNDGGRRAGFTTPSVDGQAEVIAEALMMSDVASDSIGYVEAHGTATHIGDPIEVRALERAFRAGTKREQYCPLGSLKANVGHMGAAAGVGGLIKTILAIQNGVIPPTLHYRQPNPLIDFKVTPFFVNAEIAPWPSSANPRRAGVSSFGQGGTNVHVVLEQAPPVPKLLESGNAEVLPISARTGTTLDALTRDILDAVLRSPFDLASIAYTLQVGRKAFPFRRAVVCRSKMEAAEALRKHLAGAPAIAPEAAADASLAAEAWTSGADVEWKRFWSGRSGRRVPLPTHPFERHRHWIEAKMGPALSLPSTRTVTGSTSAEELVAQVFAAVLGVPSVDPDVSFFDLGGHSLLEPQVRSRLKAVTGIDLPQGFLWECPSASELGKFLRERRATPGLQHQGSSEAMRDIALDSKITSASRCCVWPAPMRSVFLTGATGLFGSHVLHELLRSTSFKIYCLVRAGSEAEALDRIRHTLDVYRLPSEGERRIVPVPGDLACPQFGLPGRQFNELGANIDAIYHAGAQVNFVQPYSALKRINVTGTHEVLRLAAAGGPNPVHHISSIAVFECDSFGPGGYAYEDEDLSASAGFHNGYDLSKWVAERLVALARERGLWASIYRLGNISGHSSTGVMLPEHILACLIKGCIQLGSAPAEQNIVNIMPADAAAAALVRLSLRPANTGSNYHVLNPAWTSIRDVVSWLNARAHQVEPVSYQEWLHRLRGAPENNAFKPFLPLVEQAPLFTNRRYDTANAEHHLGDAGVRCPSFDEQLLDVYLEYWKSTQFLPNEDES
jgi:thioester reductase-like protein